VAKRTPYDYPLDIVLNVEKAEEEMWKKMVRELFDVPAGTDIAQWTFWRENLHVMPRLLLRFVNSNIMPRTRYREKVRLYEVLALYALMTGTPALSARHLIMHNIWEAREKQDKMAITHCRLLSKMLKKQGGLAG
jgi:hypothetical protein